MRHKFELKLPWSSYVAVTLLKRLVTNQHSRDGRFYCKLLLTSHDSTAKKAAFENFALRLCLSFSSWQKIRGKHCRRDNHRWSTGGSCYPTAHSSSSKQCPSHTKVRPAFLSRAVWLNWGSFGWKPSKTIESVFHFYNSFFARRKTR